MLTSCEKKNTIVSCNGAQDENAWSGTMIKDMKQRLARLELNLHQSMAFLLALKIATALKEHISHTDIESFNSNDEVVNIKLINGRVLTLNRKTEKLVYDSDEQVH
jgi:hypothetical protein